MIDALSEPLRRRWERTPLRLRLVASVLVLVAGALVLTSVANVKSLEEYLTNRVDEDLASRLGAYGEREVTAMLFGGTTKGDYAFFVVGSDDEIRNFSDMATPLPELTSEILRENAGVAFTRASADGGVRWRVLSRVSHGGLSDGQVSALATPMSQVETTVGRLIWIDLLVGAGVLAGLTAIGVALVRASLWPLKEIEHTAAAIAAGDLSKRVPRWDTRTEVGRLGEAFNTMLGRIESALAARAVSEERARASEERMRRFVADASHELRTPLTTVRGFAELYRQRPGSAATPEETAMLMRRIEDEATRMGLLVEDLLLLARLDQERPVADRQVDLLSVAVDTVTAALVTASDHRIDLRTEGGPFLVRGDDLRLRQVLSNLIGNAVQHTPAGTTIQVTLRRVDCRVQMAVADNGPGMTAEQAERVFERFYRADKARSRAAGGTGLGLAIVSALVAAHNGTVEVSAEPGEGAVFTVTLAIDPDVLAVGDRDPADDDGPSDTG